MKKLTIITVLIMFSMTLFSQLNDNARNLKENVPNFYVPIKTFAVDKWGNDNSMIVFTINRQSDAWFELKTLIDKVSNEQVEIFLLRWSKNIDNYYCTDWTMIVFEIKRHLKNSDY